MANVIDVSLGAKNYVNPNEAIDESAFGVEFLGWEYFSNFEERAEQVEVHHIRWPGGIPIEDGINVDGSPDGSREQVYHLQNDNVVDWDRADGSPREGIEEMMNFAVENNASFSFVAPTSRYVEQLLEEGEDVALDTARDDIRFFVENLVSKNYGKIPSDFTIELGSEYYSTQVWAKHTTDESGTPYSSDPGGLPSAFGKVFAAMADEIDQVLSDPELNPEAIDINIAVQLGRNGDGNAGTYEDNLDFIEAFIDAGSLDAVDSLIYHRYIPTFDNIGRGTEWNSNGHNLEDAMGLWEDAAGKEFDLTAGYLSPAAQSPGKLEYNEPGLTNILQMNADLLSQGMDQGSIYALGHSTSGSLGWRGDVFIGGQLYDMMAESLPGLYLHDGFQQNTSNVENLGESYVESEDVNTYVYENDTQVVLFLAARDFEGDSLNYTINFDEPIAFGEVTRLWANGEELKHSQTGEVVGVYGESSDEPAVLITASGNTSIPITFNHDYEVIRLVLEKSPETYGTSGDDTLRGSNDADQIVGLEGNDSLTGYEGNDTIKSGWGDDTVFAGPGDDRVTSDWGNDIIWGGTGDDKLFGGIGQSVLSGEGGNDYLSASGAADTLIGGTGNDTLIADSDHTTLVIDQVEKLTGSDERDVIHHFSLGEDFIEIEGVQFGSKPGQISREDYVREHAAINGNDLEITLENGHQIIILDLIDGVYKNPTVDDYYQVFYLETPSYPVEETSGTVEDNTIIGLDVQDKILGKEGDDYIAGGGGADTVKGGWGDDTVSGDSGDDKVSGDFGDDLLFGGTGNDRVFGGSGDDTLSGGMGNDYLVASGNTAHLYGEQGNDTLVADADETILTFAQSEEVSTSSERDVVWEFSLGVDFLEIEGLDFGYGPDQISRETFIEEHGTIKGSDLEITLEDGHTIVLRGIVDDLYEDAALADFYQVFAIGVTPENKSVDSQPNLEPELIDVSEDDNGPIDQEDEVLNFLIEWLQVDQTGYRQPDERFEEDEVPPEQQVYWGANIH